MRSALVTGSSGFIGRHFAAALEAGGYKVSRSDIDTPLASGDCRYWFASTDPDGEPLTFDLVIHCAALVDGRETIENKAALLGAYNLQLDGALFEWALRARPGRIVYFSSSAAYPTILQEGTYRGLRLTERDIGSRGEPDATYGWVKLTGERIAQEVRQAGVPVTVVRPFSGYGEDQADCYPFPAMIARGRRRDSPFDVWGNGSQVRDFIHVDDIVAAVLALVDHQVDGPVNLGTGVGTSMDELAGMVMDAAGYQAAIRRLPGKPTGVNYRVADPTLMRRYYQPQVTLEEGIRRCLTP